MRSIGRICVLGGDGRTAAMAQRLRELGAEVTLCGRAGGEDTAQWEAEQMGEATAILLPTPAFGEDGCIYRHERGLHAEELFALVKDKVPVFGGRIAATMRQAALCAGVCLQDYMALEEVQLRNAVPSAEGAIALCMRELDVTLQGANVAVVGYGRLGTALASRLFALGANVSVAVRKQVDATRVRCDRMQPVLIGEGGLQTFCCGYDVIFNTVPARIWTDALLCEMSPQTLMIELASCPGGWSPQQAAAYGLRVLYAPGLPAKYAPRTAGRLIAEALVPYLESEVENR